MNKKLIAAAAAVVLGLCSCAADSARQDEPGASRDIQITENGETAPVSSAGNTEAATPEEDEEISSAEAVPPALDELVTVKSSVGDFGKVNYPVFSSDKLDPADAGAANAYFESIKKSIEDNINEYLAAGSEAAGNSAAEISTVECSADNGILSVIMRYDYVFGYPVTYSRTINFDIVTGKVLPAEDVIKRYGFTEEEAVNAALWYCKAYLRREARYNMIYDCFYDGTLPEGEVTDGAGWQELYDLTAERYVSAARLWQDNEENKGTPWEALPLSPFVYCGDGRLYVSAAIPSGLTGSLYDLMIAVGHNDIETASLNRDAPFAPISDRKYLSPKGAVRCAEYFSPDDREPPEFKVEGIECIPIDSEDPAGHFAYIVRPVNGENPGFAVGILDDLVWVITDEGDHRICPQGSPLIELSWGMSIGALGAVVRNPDDYFCWSSEPVFEFDASDGDPYAETILVTPVSETAEITFLKGTVKEEDGWDFSGEPVISFTLDAGKYALIKCSVPEVIPSCAVEFKTASDKGTYTVWYDGTGDGNKTEYVLGEWRVESEEL